MKTDAPLNRLNKIVYKGEAKRRCTMMYYTGVDYHRKVSCLTVMDKEGKILKEAKLLNPKKLYTLFSKILSMVHLTGTEYQIVSCVV